MMDQSLGDDKPKFAAEYRTIEVTPDDLVTYPKVHRLYKVRIVLPARDSEGAWLPNEEEFYFKQRYSVLLKANLHVSQNIQRLFPAKHAFEDFSRDMKNVEQRAKDLNKYFNAALRDISSLSNKLWHKAIGVTEQQSIYLLDIAYEMNRKAINQKAGNGTIMMEELYAYSQFFHLHYPSTMEAAVLSFTKPMKFVVTYLGIFGPDANIWFPVTKSALFTSQYVISNNNGQDLMSIDSNCGLCNIMRCSRGQQVRCSTLNHNKSVLNPSNCKVTKVGELCPDFELVDGSYAGLKIVERGGLKVNIIREAGGVHKRVIVRLPPHADVMLYLALALALEITCSNGATGRSTDVGIPWH